MRTCGECINHDPVGLKCMAGMSYAAWVYEYTPVNGCPGFVDRERATAETLSQQSQARGPVPGPYQHWLDIINKVKP